MIYADNAASTRVSDAAMAAMTPFFTRYYGNPSATHSLGKNLPRLFWRLVKP